MTTKLYSPRQATMASFFGGPLAALQVLRENFLALEQPERSRTALRWGLAFVVALLMILPFLPEKFPNTIIPLAYSVAVGEFVKIYQLSKEKIRESGAYQFQSNWRVARVSALGFVLFAVIIVAWIIILGYLGVIDLA
jgi:archaellum biogenesis protein FlaJ (TadC family)